MSTLETAVKGDFDELNDGYWQMMRWPVVLAVAYVVLAVTYKVLARGYQPIYTENDRWPPGRQGVAYESDD